MYELIISIKGKRIEFKYDPTTDEFVLSSGYCDEKRFKTVVGLIVYLAAD